MRLSLFCDGKTVVFEVPDDEGMLFISCCREALVSEGCNEAEVEEMTNDKVVRKAIGNMDYNCWHRFDRHNSHSEIQESDIKEDSAEDIVLENIEREQVRTFIASHLPESQAEVYFMHVIEGLRFFEIARLIRDKEDNVLKRFHRAKRQMEKLKNFKQTPSDFCLSTGYLLSDKQSAKEK